MAWKNLDRDRRRVLTIPTGKKRYVVSVVREATAGEAPAPHFSQLGTEAT